MLCFTITEPPWFTKRQRVIRVEVFSSATLSCKAHGDSPLTLQWTKDNEEIPSTARCGVAIKYICYIYMLYIYMMNGIISHVKL